MTKRFPVHCIGLCLAFFFVVIGVLCDHCEAEVVRSGADGFQIKIETSLKASPKESYRVIVEEFNRWWDADHSYSGQASNLSLDLKQRCMLERLPDGGFVRHMEIVYHAPGQSLRMTGGLGPLQDMGVTGALTFTLAEDSGDTKLTVTYNVCGAAFLELHQVSQPVDGVLSAQVVRLKKHLAKGK